MQGDLLTRLLTVDERSKPEVLIYESVRFKGGGLAGVYYKESRWWELQKKNLFILLYIYTE